MVQFYYNKYTTVSRKVVKSTYVGTAYATNGYPSYNIVNDLFYHSGTYEYNTPGSLPVGRSVYEASNGSNTIIRYDFVNANDVVSYRLELVPEPTKGSLVQSNIAAEDGTYPANGQHTDGFWYVKGSVAGPLPKGMVTNNIYSVVGNGGRKMALMSNGWIVVVTKTTNNFFFYVDKRDGLGYKQLMFAGAQELNAQDVDIVANGSMLHIICGWNNTQVRHASIDVTTVTNPSTNMSNLFTTIIHNNLTATGYMSLTIDPLTGYLHAAWSCKNATHPNTYNIYFGLSNAGGATWNSPTALNMDPGTGRDRRTPTIVVYKGVPTIIWDVVIDATTYGLLSATWKAGSLNYKWLINGTTVRQYNPSAVVDQTGVIHVVWAPDATNTIYYSKSTDGGTTWSIQTNVASGTATTKANSPSITVDKNNTVFVAWQQAVDSAYIEIRVRECNNGVWSAAKAITSPSKHLQNASTLYDPKFSVLFGKEVGSVGYPPVAYDTLNYSVNFFGDITANNNPTIAILSPTNNQTLYENDTISISGDAYDEDKDQSVAVYYQINSEQRKVLATNLSQTQIALSKQLTFKGGKLYDGDTALTGTLADGVAHTLKVWAEDSEKASSANVERTFYVVPNRAPLLSVDAVVPSGVVDADKFKISGTASDQDANSTVKVTRRINAGNAVEIYSGTGGAWEFDLSLSQLVAGQNTIVIEVVDNYGAKTSKTITLNKNELKTPILQSVARYKIEPPKGSARGVLLFIQRDEKLDVKVELSMTLSGEQEQYETLTPVNTAPVQQGIVEDTFEHEGLETKQNIILKITPSRTDLSFNHKIHLISGAVD